MRLKNCVPFLFVLCVCLLLAFPAGTPAADEWQPVNPADLALKDNPVSPGSDAMILYREEHTDASQATFDEYYRVKIFTEAGKKYGDIEIPFEKGQSSVGGIHARTIRPDGTIVPFDGQIFEKEIVKAGGIKVLEKTFSMPGVQPGCILDYKYRIQRDMDYYWNIAWNIQEDLFTRDASFSIHPPSGVLAPAMYSRTFGLSQQIKPEKQKNGDYAFTVHNISGFTKEDYMLPEDMLRGRVEFYFKGLGDSGLQTTQQFWKNEGKKLNQAIDSFVNKKSALQQAVAQTTSSTDSPETKLRKLYARVQTIRNLNYEDRTSQEWKRLKIQDNNNVEDVLKHDYGYERQINELFVGLARAAGFEANEVFLTPRNQRLFMPDLQDVSELDDDVVGVKLGGQEIFLDPAAKFYPFGILPWEETIVNAFLVNKDGGDFVQIPNAKSTEAVIERHATMKLNDDGSLSGTLEVDFTGVEGCITRQDERTDDETGRKKDLTDEIKGWLPANAKFEITKTSGWDDLSAPLVISGTLTIPGYASSVGSRVLVPITPFIAGEPRSFQPASRVNDVYFNFAHQQLDDIFVTVPPNFQVESLPKQPANAPTGGIQYTLSFSQLANSFEVKRSLAIEGIYFKRDLYPAIRQAFNTIKTGDNEQAVLQTLASAHQN